MGTVLSTSKLQIPVSVSHNHIHPAIVLLSLLDGLVPPLQFDIILDQPELLFIFDQQIFTFSLLFELEQQFSFSFNSVLDCLEFGDPFHFVDLVQFAVCDFHGF